MKTLTDLKKYIEQVTGDSVSPLPVNQTELSGLPAYLAQLYSIYRVTLYHHDLFLAIANTDSRLTPGELERDIRKFQKTLGPQVAVVLMNLTSYDRLRLIQRRVPFIVPGRQMFMPMFGVDLREYALTATEPRMTTLSGISQLLILYQLQMDDLSGLTLREIAARFNYSSMAVTKAARELLHLGLCEIHATGREKHLEFVEGTRFIWDKAGHVLRSPLKRIHPISTSLPGVWKYPRSGLAALSVLTDLSYESVPVIAVYDRTYRQLLSNREIQECHHSEDASVLIEEWRYDPDILARNNAVDPLSLYLSLAADSDERVQQALVKLLENVAWSRD